MPAPPTREPWARAPASLATMSPTEADQLFLLAEAGVERLRVRAAPGPDVPPARRQADGLAPTVDEAMRQAPIPHALGPGRPCRCSYRPADDG